MDEMHRRDAPGYRDMRTDEERFMVSPHIETQTDGGRRMIFPACQITIGSIRARDKTDYSPSITLYSLMNPTGLIFVPTVEEMEALGNELLKQAKAIRDAADKAAADLIARAGR